MRQLLIEILHDQNKLKFGNQTVTTKKLYQILSSALYHAPNSSRCTLFCKFL